MAWHNSVDSVGSIKTGETYYNQYNNTTVTVQSIAYWEDADVEFSEYVLTYAIDNDSYGDGYGQMSVDEFVKLYSHKEII